MTNLSTSTSKIITVLASAFLLTILIASLYVFVGYQLFTTIEVSHGTPVSVNVANEFANPPRQTRGRLTESSDLEKPNASNETCAYKMRGLGVVSDSCSDIEPVVTSLRRGDFIFNKPNQAFIGRPLTIVMILKTNDDQDTQTAFAVTKGPKQTITAPYARSIESTLRGLDFEIDPSGPQRRTVTSLEPVKWEWTVIPEKSGVKIISIDVDALISIQNELLPYRVNTMQTELRIVVTPAERVKQFLTTGGGVIWAVCSALTTLIAVFSASRPFHPKLKRYFRRPRSISRRGLS